MANSRIRQNYHLDSEAAVNSQVNLFHSVAYVYESLTQYFDRDDVALPGFRAFCSKHNSDHKERADKLMEFQNKRGGKLLTADISRPQQDAWGSGLEAMQSILQLEKNVETSLRQLHQLASQHNDAHMADLIEGEYLEVQVSKIKEISDYITVLRKVGPGQGEYLFDKETLQAKYK